MTATSSPSVSAENDMAISKPKPAAEPPRKDNPEMPKPEAPMPTGSGVLGSRPRPAGGASTGMDPEAAERRRFEREIKEKS
jgi:hypothetical protein